MEIAKRAGEAGAGLAAAAQAAAVKNSVAEQHAYNRRVTDTHRQGMQALGLKVPEGLPGELEGSMGDIIVTGDLYGDAAVAAMHGKTLQPNPPSPAKAPESPKAGMSTRAKIIMALGTAALASVIVPSVGVSLAARLGLFDQPRPAESVDFNDQDTFPGVVIERPPNRKE